ncbi:hypothetical protein GA0061070_103054 [Kosakonia oryziphila]|jgi:hypothetical protein|uniref:Uncharacterized protein n=1 Tax=Kosakonia oryziphila TaxID=1005667 RepID=A0A1C4F306_9ENTR|nr:hypothetical protein GA0061070_103054 [Kosakonia oryziphila]
MIQGDYFPRLMFPEDVPEWYLTTFPGLIAHEEHRNAFVSAAPLVAYVTNFIVVVALALRK